ncbi:cell envelope integrity EipB family protein [Ahrensia kielensis]|uniref:Cell envelope integrity EipB family protein n=1 Tax=Ahrensia kielensis TaxID=76980 RepID=A0ABU9T3Y3_9HYPH
MRPIFTKYQIALSCAALAGFTVPANTAFAEVNLVPHRAVYDVNLDEASERSGINGMSGRIVYEFRGSTCEGYTTSFRFVNRVTARGESNVTDQRTSTYEDAEGENFRFVTQAYVNDKKDREIEGRAVSKKDNTAVALAKPDEVNLELSPAMFPTAHIVDLLNRADAGETFFELPIFDGSDGGDRVLSTTVIVGSEQTNADEDKAVLGAMADDDYRKVTISYFDKADKQEALPEYTIAFKLYNNGVTRDLEMDYGEFSLTGKITDLELIEAESCEG